MSKEHIPLPGRKTKSGMTVLPGEPQVNNNAAFNIRPPEPIDVPEVEVEVNPIVPDIECNVSMQAQGDRDISAYLSSLTVPELLEVSREARRLIKEYKDSLNDLLGE